jgi:hypothetical protein
MGNFTFLQSIWKKIWKSNWIFHRRRTNLKKKSKKCAQSIDFIMNEDKLKHQNSKDDWTKLASICKFCSSSASEWARWNIKKSLIFLPDFSSHPPYNISRMRRRWKLLLSHASLLSRMIFRYRFLQVIFSHSQRKPFCAELYEDAKWILSRFIFIFLQSHKFLPIAKLSAFVSAREQIVFDDCA